MTRLAVALGLSLSLHCLLGEVAVQLADRPMPLAAVDVEVLDEPIPLPARVVVTPGPAEPHHPRPIASTKIRRRPVPVGSPPAFVITPAAVVDQGQVSVAGAAPTPFVGSEPAPEVTGGSAAEPDLGLFVERLKRSARRCSPRRLGPGGEASLARVRFCVSRSGRPEAVTLLQSTGDARLDRAAVDCVIPGAAPLPASDRCLVVPLRFNL
jgi:TonB family protein